MAIRDGQFNLKNFNIDSDQYQYMRFSRRGTMRFQAIVGASVIRPFFRKGRVIFHNSTIVSVALPFNRSSRLYFQSTIIPHKITRVMRNSLVRFLGNFEAGKDMNHTRLGQSNFNTRLHAGKVLHTVRKLRTLFNTRIHIGKRVQLPKRTHWMMFDGIVAMGLVHYAVATINVSIPPGGELRIDSNAFTAMLEGENVLHEYHGQWVHFDRNTSSLIIHAGTGGELDGELLYNWRFI